MLNPTKSSLSSTNIVSICCLIYSIGYIEFPNNGIKDYYKPGILKSSHVLVVEHFSSASVLWGVICPQKSFQWIISSISMVFMIGLLITFP